MIIRYGKALRFCSTLSKFIPFLLILFLLFFPKGGFKIVGIPLTWGYLLLGMVSFILLFREKFHLYPKRVIAYFFTLPFQIVSLFTIFRCGFDYLGLTISFFLGFFILPFFFFVLLGEYIERLDWPLFQKLLKSGIFFISWYGILLFLSKTLIDRFIEIPFLTVNYGDIGILENKHIHRGFVYKLISTYNNGNLYGICLLMLLPLYCLYENKTWKKRVVTISLILTLSRAVWFGLLFSKICQSLFLSKNRKVPLIKTVGIAALFLSFFSILFILFQIPWTFLLDTTGRNHQIRWLFSSGLIGKERFQGILEMIYFSVLYNFGWIGFFTFLLALIGSICICRFKRSIVSLEHKAIFIGIVTYLFVSFADGAILLIPVLAFFWFLNSLLFRKTFVIT